MRDFERILKRQQLLADFGDFTLRSNDLDVILTEACRLVGEALGTGRAKILEIQQAEQCLLVRAGVGWDPGIIGHLRLSMEEHSSETFAIKAGAPVISQDINKEERFELPASLKEAGVGALINVPIFLPGGQVFGLLQVDAVEPREFAGEDIQFLRTYAGILGPVIDRLLLTSELRSTQERFRLTVEAALDYAIFISDARDRITDWLPGAQAVFGWTPEEAIGRPSAIVFTPEDRETHQAEWEIETARAEGVAPNVRWHIRNDGRRVFIEGSTRALRDPDGTLRGFLKIGQDVTARRRGQESLRESEARFRQFGDASPDLLWIRNAETKQLEYLSPVFSAIYGHNREEALSGDTLAGWAALLNPEDREQALANLERVRAGERITHEFRIVRPSDGETRWIEDTDFPLFGEDGRVERVAGIAKDVTDAKASAARLEVLNAELQHRSRNLLGVIASLASKTLGKGEPVSAFHARLKALSRAQGLLSQAGSDTVEVAALVRAELAAHVDAIPPKVEMSGPRVKLNSSQVQNFALALHELTTNAVKYGALRDGTGRVAVHWVTSRDQTGHNRLTLTWTETGVDLQPEKVTRRGYGRELIEKALSYALGGETEYVLGKDGVNCRISLPLT